MNNEIINSVNDLLKYIHPSIENISRLLATMDEKKKNINKSLGLTEKNNYRLIMDTTLSDSEFEIEYPYCYKLVNYLSKDNKFSIIDNWIMVKKNKMKLSKYLNKFDWNIEVPTDIYKGMINELGRNDSTALFDVAKSKSVVISTNMYDFLTSATNTSFRSCYTIDGSHFNGNIAYCRDSFTAIVYTYSKDITRKIGRFYIYIFPETKTFVVSRIYGSMYNAEIRKATEEIQKRIDVGGKWNVNYYEYRSELYANARPFYDGPLPVYFDAPYTRIFHTNKILRREAVPFLHFEYSICLKCGRKNRNGHYGICERCQESVGKCKHCSTPIHNDYNIRGHRICPECQMELYERCPHCGDIHHKSYIKETPDGEMWCTNCIDNEYWYCVLCNKLHRIDKAKTIGKSPVCPECWGKYIVSCSECGINLIDKPTYRMAYKLDNKKFCKSCYSNQEGNKVFIAGKYRAVQEEDGNYNIDNYYHVIRPRCGEIHDIASSENNQCTWTTTSSVNSATEGLYYYTNASIDYTPET